MKIINKVWDTFKGCFLGFWGAIEFPLILVLFALILAFSLVMFWGIIFSIVYVLGVIT